MKRHTLFLFILGISLSAASVRAQDDDRSGGDLPIQIGPVAAINGAVNMADYQVDDQQRTLGLGSFFGVAADFPLSESISVVARLGYNTLSFSDENTAVDIPTAGGTDYDYRIPEPYSLKTEGSFNYLSLGTSLRAGYFSIGLNFSLPMTATITNTVDGVSLPVGFGQYVLKSDISPTDDELNFMFEATVGGDIPLYSSKSGTLRLGIFASYPLTQAISGNGMNLPHLDRNLRLPSVMLQVGYLFSM